MLDLHPNSRVWSGALWAVSEAASLHAFVLVHCIHNACPLVLLLAPWVGPDGLFLAIVRTLEKTALTLQGGCDDSRRRYTASISWSNVP